MNKFRDLVPIFLALGISGFPLIAGLSGAVGVPNRPLAISFRALFLLIALILILASLFWPKSHRRERLGVIAFGGFWLLYAARITWDTTVLTRHLALPGIDYWLFSLGVCFLPALAALCAVNERSVSGRPAQRWTIAVVLVATVLTSIAAFRELALDGSRSAETGRLTTEVLNPISIGHLGASLAILGITMHSHVAKVNLASSLFRMGVMGLGLVILFLSGSRGPVVALACSLLVAIVVRQGARPLQMRASLVIAATSVGVFLAVAFVADRFFPQAALAERLSVFVEGAGDASSLARQSALSGALDDFAESPLLGSGLEERSSRFYPHNVIVEGFMALGLVGGVLFVTMLWFSTKAALVTLRKPSYRWLGLLYVQYVVAAQFSGALWNSAVMWLLIGAVLGMAEKSTPVHSRKLSLNPA